MAPGRGQKAERRADPAGDKATLYTRKEFVEYYGAKEGQRRWDSATQAHSAPKSKKRKPQVKRQADASESEAAVSDGDLSDLALPDVVPEAMDRTKLRLIVFDFDQTISVFHVFKTLAGWGGGINIEIPAASTELGQLRLVAELDTHPAFEAQGGFALAMLGGQERVDKLQACFEELRSRGVELLVCTKGLVGPCRRCLTNTGLIDYFEMVYGLTGEDYGFGPHDERLRGSGPPDSEESKLLGTSASAGWNTKAELIMRLRKSGGILDKLPKDLQQEEAMLVEDDIREIQSARGISRTLFVTDASGMTEPDLGELISLAPPKPLPKPTPPPAPTVPKKEGGVREKSSKSAKSAAGLPEGVVEAATSVPAKVVEFVASEGGGIKGAFKITEAQVGDVPDGGLLLQVLCMAAEPYQICPRSADCGVVQGAICGRVLVSRCNTWQAGEYLGAFLPLVTVQVVPPEDCARTSGRLQRLTGFVDEGTASRGLGPLGLPGAVAFGGLFDVLRPRRMEKAGEPNGESIFVNGASGPVGYIVGQLAKRVGCVVIGTAQGDDQCGELKRKYGYDHVVDSRLVSSAEELEARLKEHCPAGLDMCFDNVGGIGFDAAIALMSSGGRVAVCGSEMLNGDGSWETGSSNRCLNIASLIYRGIRVEGIAASRWLSHRANVPRIQGRGFIPRMSRFLKQGVLVHEDSMYDGIERWGAAFETALVRENGRVVAVKV